MGERCNTTSTKKKGRVREALERNTQVQVLSSRERRRERVFSFYGKGKRGGDPLRPGENGSAGKRYRGWRFGMGKSPLAVIPYFRGREGKGDSFVEQSKKMKI